MNRRKLSAEECTKRIAYSEKQFEIHKMYAMYWQTMALTGVAITRELSQGREPTDEEKANGNVIGWRKLSDEEKTKEALDTMNRHIHHMDAIKDCISILMDGEEPGPQDMFG